MYIVLYKKIMDLTNLKKIKIIKIIRLYSTKIIIKIKILILYIQSSKKYN